MAADREDNAFESSIAFGAYTYNNTIDSLGSDEAYKGGRRRNENRAEEVSSAYVYV